MDVVRITQALRQQNPARYPKGSSGNVLSTPASSPATPLADEPLALHRSTWDSSLETTHQDNHSNTVHSNKDAPASPTSSTPASPSSSYFALPASFSLASLLPSTESGFFSGASSSSGSRISLNSGASTMGEMEVQSLLLRSMPMFGNLISRD